jgi:hypothetical protein
MDFEDIGKEGPTALSAMVCPNMTEWRNGAAFRMHLSHEGSTSQKGFMPSLGRERMPLSERSVSKDQTATV